ncbi:hypothetical protein [Paraburkholderia sp. BR10882]|uniref:hypothetical protein n=1 Tax=unclassified Paraburkholderia TaxID=2615204 RepID=UPI0034CE314A
MSRNAPKVLHEHNDKQNNRLMQVVEQNDTYVVLYEGKPFSEKLLKTEPVGNVVQLKKQAPHYVNTTFTSAGPAHNLADRLNARYRTDKFAAFKVTDVTQA